MSDRNNPSIILIADDDPEDRMLAEEALRAARICNEIRFVEDGEQLMDYFKRRGPYAIQEDAPWPLLLLLDLKMPRKDGLEALLEMRTDEELRRVPVVMLTTSSAEEDILRSYDLGVNSFITKPVTFDGLVRVMEGLGEYWFELVTLPPRRVNP